MAATDRRRRHGGTAAAATGGYTGGGGGAGPAGPGGSGGHGVAGGGQRQRRHVGRLRRRKPTQAHQPTRKPNGVPTNANPTLTDRRLRPRPARRPELHHRPVLDPALPAPHLPGLRHPVRDPLGGAGGHQPDRDRLRHQPQRLDGGRGRLDAVHPLDLEDVRGRRKRRRPQGSLQPGRRDLRRGALPEGRRRRHRPADRDLRLQPRRLVRRRGAALRPPVRQASRRTSSARSPASPRATASRSPPTPATPTTSPSAAAAKRAKPSKGASGNVADVVSSSPTRRGINIYSHDGAPVVAVNDGTIKRIGHNAKLGNYVVLQDTYGNRFTYAQLGHVSKVYPVPKQHKLSAADFKLVTPEEGQGAEQPATRGKPLAPSRAAARQRCRQAARQAGSRGREGRVQHRQGAGEHRGPAAAALRPARAPPQRRPRRDHGPARPSAVEEVPRLLDLQVLLRRRAPLQPQLDGAAAAPQGLAGRRRHRARPDREDRQARAAPELLDPARRHGRPEDRPEADPRRLEAARGDGDLPRRRQEPVLVHGRPERDPGPADAEDAARAPGARRPAPLDLRSAAATTSAPARSTSGSWRRWSTSPTTASG